MLNDRELLNKYQESQQRENELLSRIRELEAQNLDLKDSVDVEKKKSLEQEFKKASRGLTANELNVKALALWNNGMYTDAERAIEYLNQAIGLDPDYYATYNHLGMAYFSKGDYESAV